MICAGISEILYSEGTFGENSCIVCTYLLLAYAPAVMLHSIRTMFTLMMFTGKSDSYHFSGFNTRAVENPSIGPMVFDFAKFIQNAHLISLFMVLMFGQSDNG